jgi:hypothetical protein
MIRLISFIAILMFAGVSGALYKLKYKVQSLDRQALTLQRQILAEREAVRLLEADWAYLNQPDRLQAMAERHLTLGPIDTRQFATIASIPARLVPLSEVPTTPSAKPDALIKPPAAPPVMSDRTPVGAVARLAASNGEMSPPNSVGGAE